MKRILSCSAAAICLLVPVLRSQSGEASAGLSIGAAETYVVAARGLQLGARAVNSRGAVLRGRNYDWQVSDAGIATIDSTGTLYGRSPGVVDVTVQDHDSGAAASRRFFVYPVSVVIDSGNATVQAGDTLKLSAQAKDADGKAIPGVQFKWYSELSGVARVSPEGMLTGVAEGRVTVSAVIDIGPGVSRFSTYAGVLVLRRAAYKLKTLVSGDASAQALTTLVPTRVAVAGQYVAGITSVSNGGQALVLWQNGRLLTLSTTGASLSGQVITRFGSVTVNSQGDVAVIAETQAEWCRQIFALFPAGAKTPTILDDTTRCNYRNLTANSIDRQRSIVYRYANTLYHRKADGSPVAILATGDRPAGIDVVNNISDWSITPAGKVLIEAQNGSNVSVYFAWDGAALRKLYTATDMVGTYAAQWAKLPAEVAPDEYITRIGGSNWASLSRLKNGVWSIVAVSGQNDIGWVQDGFGGSDGTIFFFADRNGKTVLFRNSGTTNEVLGTYANWRELSMITATGGDSAVAYGTLGESTPRAVRFRGTATDVILGRGLALEGAAALAITQGSIPKGVNSAGTILRTYGDSLVRAGPGTISTILEPGGTLPVGDLTSVGAVAGNRQGDIVFTAQHGPKMALYTYRGGQVQGIADTDDRLSLSAAQIYSFSSNDSQIAMNNSGHIAATTSHAGGNGIYLYSGAASAPAASVVVKNGSVIPGTGLTFSSTNQVAIDENDRVAFIANTSAGRTGLFVWERGNIRQILETGQPDPNGRNYQSLHSLQAGGTRFYLRVAVAGLNEILVVDGTAVKVLATEGSLLSFGMVLTNFLGSELAANSRGDVVFPALTSAGHALVVKRADGTDVPVALGSVRGPAGEWFLNLYGAGISEQGDLVFSTLTWAGGRVRLALYQALAN